MDSVRGSIQVQLLWKWTRTGLGPASLTCKPSVLPNKNQLVLSSRTWASLITRSYVLSCSSRLHFSGQVYVKQVELHVKLCQYLSFFEVFQPLESQNLLLFLIIGLCIVSIGNENLLKHFNSTNFRNFSWKFALFFNFLKLFLIKFLPMVLTQELIIGYWKNFYQHFHINNFSIFSFKTFNCFQVFWKFRQFLGFWNFNAKESPLGFVSGNGDCVSIV